ncbi:MAG: hypothetical protein DRI57_18240 [Deltaproteobacteria bacterium]|nr:MAG: hypothetical protein DRI57_18240 [Deltaproteobacteria bacterium]
MKLSCKFPAAAYFSPYPSRFVFSIYVKGCFGSLDKIPELRKNIGSRQYIVYGPNAVILEWARHSDLAKSVYDRRELTEGTLFQAVCTTNPEEMCIHAKKAIQALWRSYPELGPYPFLETLSDFEFSQQFFPGYREHVIHQLRVFLTGLYLFDLYEFLQKQIS